MPDTVVLVTGASGFIASHVVKLLLEEGHKVRGTVRSLQNALKVDHLKELVQNPKHPLELVEADLTKDEGWDKALEGVTSLIHMASPFPNVAEVTVKEEDLVGPAKEGTLRVLRAASAVGVKRVVLTSSVASICAEANPKAEKAYNEEDWTDPEDATVDLYSKSKTLAEKAAWDYLKELPEEQKFELAVINPTLVMGPVLTKSHRDATSVQVMSQILNKAYPALPHIAFNICDVRDVAAAHVKALSVPEAAGKRHIITTQSLWMKELSAILAKEFQAQGYSISTMEAPYFLTWIAGLFSRPLRSYILPRVGKTLKLENKRMQEVLRIEPTPVETSIIDMAYSLIDLDIIRKAKNYKKVGSRAEKAPVVENDVKETEKSAAAETKPEAEDQEKEQKPSQ